jgi:hypothetical protein
MAVAASILVFETAAAATLTAFPALRQRVLTLVVAHLPMHHSSRASARASSPDPEPPPAPVAPAPVVAPPVEAVAPEPMPAPAPSPAVHSPPSKRRVVSTSTAGDGEVELYSRALSQLNVAHDPAGALGTLGVYRFKHPNGLFRREVAVAEIRADMMLDRDAEFEEQRKVVLHDWQLYHAGKEG